jgi:hypothetical protein
VRVAVLLVILAGVLAFAFFDVKSRRARNTWDHTLAVAVVLLQSTRLDPAATSAVPDRLAALEKRLTSEYARNAGISAAAARPPFHFTLFGPKDLPHGHAAPAPDSDGIVDLAKHAMALRRWVSAVDESVGLLAGPFDARIYVTAHLPTARGRTMVEGASEQGGRIGTVDVDLDPSMVDFALIVVTHELFHTLGANDHYGPEGQTRIPDGLADPAKTPRFPQDAVEVMARNRPLDESHEVPPEGLAELAVGPTTAREIGWIP